MSTNSYNEQTFLIRLTQITKENLTNNQFGVCELAKEMGMSRSHLHRKIKTINNQSLSQFIREIRLKVASDLLKENKLTISEIAYDVGFGSPSYFIKCFHEYFGFPPGEYLKYTSENMELHNGNLAHEYDKSSKSKNSYFLKVLYSIVAIFVAVSLVVVIYLINQNRTDVSHLLPTEKSIAVLPLKILGAEPETQILADGVMEDILTRLSHIEKFTVKSRNSSEIYRNSTKTTPQIATELGVSYLLEGTIMKEGESVRLYIQLIDAVNDKHVWSKQYDRDLIGIFSFISQVSKQIASSMETVISATEMHQLEKVYTENTEAYLLYQKGRHFWHRRSEDNLKLSINYFNQALELDSGFALAYSGLANVYMILPFHTSFPNESAYNKTIEYASKALAIDNNLDEPHVAIASAEMYYRLNWNTVEKEFLKAMKLNPNNAEAYQFYAEYLHLICEHSEARINANRAIELDPNTSMKYWVSSFLYYDEGKFDESIKAALQMLEFGEKLNWAYRMIFQNYIHLKNDSKALVYYLKYQENIPHDSNYLSKVNEVFEQTGAIGLVEYEIHRLHKQDNPDYKWMAKFYAMLENTDSTLFYLEKEFEKPQAEGIMDLKVWIDFNFLHGNSRYNALLEKINLPVD